MKKQKKCVSCGVNIYPPRIFYCSKKCNNRAKSIRVRNNPNRYREQLEYQKLWRLRNPGLQRTLSKAWREWQKNKDREGFLHKERVRIKKYFTNSKWRKHAK